MNNRTYLLLSLALATLLLSLSAPTAVATDADSDPMVTQEVETEIETASEPVEVLVTLEEPAGLTDVEERKRAVGRSQRPLHRYADSTDEVRVLNEFWISNAVLLEVEPGFRHRALLNVDGVRSMRSNTEIEVLGSAAGFSQDGTDTRALGPAGPVAGPTAATTTTASSTPYGVEQINAPDVWSRYGTKGGGVNVAVLDTGVNVSHPDIELRTTDASDPTYPGGWAEFDSEGNRVSGSEPHDTDGHGTHVSGTVVGENTGVAPGASLMHGLVVNGNTGTVAQALSGMEWAVENDADVITMSLGGNTEDAWINAVENANSMGVVVVAAVGNGGDGSSASPGNVHDVLSVGAVDSDLNVASFSGGEVIDTDSVWGDSAPSDWPSEYVVPDLVAAGVGVNSTSEGGGYGFKSGTSMATPHVAGAVALAESASGGGTVTETGNAFRFTAFGSGTEDPGTRYGYGAADALATTEILLDGASVSGTVVNGSGAPIEDAELRVNDVHVDTNSGDYSVELAEGSWSFEASAPGYVDTTETVSLSQDENAANDIVLEKPDPAFFEVSDLTGPSEAEPGETATVTAKITNTGDKADTQDVTLRLAGEGGTLDSGTVIDTRSDLSLSGGEADTVGFSLEAPSDEGSYEYGVFSADDNTTKTLTVENSSSDSDPADPAFFEVEALNAPGVVEPGSDLRVTAEVRNTGGSSATQDVTLRLAEAGTSLGASTVVATKAGVSLGSGEKTTVSFIINAPSEDGSYGYGVFSDDDSATDSLTVRESETAFFEVSDLTGPSDTEPGESAIVTAKVRNTGGSSATQDVTLRLADSGEMLDGETVVKRRDGLTVGAGRSVTVGFSLDAPSEDGSYDYGVFSDDDNETATLTVGDTGPAFFDVGALEAPAEVGVGENASVNATVRNTGDAPGVQDVTLRLNRSGEPLDGAAVVGRERDVRLNGGENTSVAFTFEAPDDTGGYVHGVFSGDDNETSTLNVEETEGGDSSLSDENPFGDETGGPIERREVIRRVVEWNTNGTIGGVRFTRDEIIRFIVEWNTARN